MSHFLKGGEGVGFFFIFVTISYVTLTLGGGGVRPKLINVTLFTVFFIEGFPYDRDFCFLGKISLCDSFLSQSLDHQ